MPLVANSAVSLPAGMSRVDPSAASFSSEPCNITFGLQEPYQCKGEDAVSVHKTLSRLGWRSYSSKFRLSSIPTPIEPMPSTIPASWDSLKLGEGVALETITEVLQSTIQWTDVSNPHLFKFPYTPYGVEAGEHSPEVPSM